MKFETREDHRRYDSGTESSIQLVFAPGIGGVDAWKHQIQYFSKRYRALTFRSGDRSLEKLEEILNSILSDSSLDNVVLVGCDVSNLAVQSFSDRENVISTVMTNFRFDLPNVRRTTYRMITTACRKPKLLKKMFLSDTTDYRIARELSNELQIPSYDEYTSYREIEAMTDVENGMVIQAKHDVLSNLEDAKMLQPDVTVREVSGGSFCFYEKPEEFNNALSEFTERLESFLKSKQIREKREKNRSLEEFEEKDTMQEQLEVR